MRDSYRPSAKCKIVRTARSAKIKIVEVKIELRLKLNLFGYDLFSVNSNEQPV
jgi:hypothetical protein